MASGTRQTVQRASRSLHNMPLFDPPGVAKTGDTMTGPLLIDQNVQGSKLRLAMKLPGTQNDAPTAFGVTSTYFGVGGGEWNAASYRLIGFGYIAAVGNQYPAVIGYEETSTSSNTRGDLVFGTRPNNNNVAPGIVMRINSAGQILAEAGAAYVPGSDGALTSKAYTDRLRTVKATVARSGHADYVCTGTNDHLQIQAAINAVSTAGGGVVLLRADPNSYRIGATITVPENIVLAGEKWARMATGGVTLQTAAGVNLTSMITVTGAANPTTNADLLHDTGFMDLTLDGNGTTTTLITYTNQDTSFITHCRLIGATNAVKTVWNSTVDPIPATIPGGLRITDCNISANGGQGIYFDKQTQCWISDCWFTAGTSATDWIVLHASNKITITGNEFNTATNAISLTDTATYATNDITINDNRFAVGAPNKNIREARTNASSNRLAYVGNTIANGTSDALFGTGNVVMNTDNGSPVSAITTATRIYGTSGTGAQTTYPFAQTSAPAGSFVMRTTGGAIVVGSGATRPASPVVGQNFFDTNLSPARPIWYNGTAWVDSAGTAV